MSTVIVSRSNSNNNEGNKRASPVPRAASVTPGTVAAGASGAPGGAGAKRKFTQIGTEQEKARPSDLARKEKSTSSTTSTPSMHGVSNDRGLGPHSGGCKHVRKLLASSSQEIAQKTYAQALRVCFDLRERTHDLSSFQLRRCKTCGDMLTTTMFCLQCPYVGCLKHKHAEIHASETNHIFGIDSRLGNIFCFVCKDYVYNYTFEKIRCDVIDKYSSHKLRKSPKTRRDLTPDESGLLEKYSVVPPCKAQSGLRGFQNMGATCFISVILQSLIHNPIIRNDFLSGGHNCQQCYRENCLSCRIDEIFTEFFSSPVTTGFGPTQLLMTAWKTQRSLAGYSEQDAHEFFQFILDQLHATSTTQPAQLHDSGSGADCNCIVHRTFCGQLRSDIMCPNCNNITMTVDPFMDLSLELRDRKGPSASARGLTLQECLEKFTSPERLETKYRCSFCQTSQVVTKQLKIRRLPLVLSIQLKRFEHALKSNKIDDHVHFPVELDMTPYTTHTSDKRYIYELFGVVCHQGKINTGHYTCSMKTREGLWFNFDDAMVTLSSEKQVLASRAYLFFYIIKDLS
ncbi:uncharacterized protein V1518DRAFT_394058 [Limtongia smithiae]|uniref:uncharacterized protein n=1 Tax=Limtongia smithiae TaxID=1125753 RepID=UPI0034CEB18A